MGAVGDLHYLFVAGKTRDRDERAKNFLLADPVLGLGADDGGVFTLCQCRNLHTLGQRNVGQVEDVSNVQFSQVDPSQRLVVLVSAVQKSALQTAETV